MLFRSFVALFTLVLGVTAAHVPFQPSRYARYSSHTTTSRGYKYNFISIMPRIFSHKPTLLFLHGFPSHAEDWHNQIDYFKAQGYGIIAPDLLGYGGTDKPTDPEEYRSKLVAQDVIDVLDSVWWSWLTPVISVSHDWGSGLASRIMLYHPKRFEGFAYISYGGLAIQSAPIDFDIVLPQLKAALGYEMLAYQEFFSKSPDAAEVVQNNIDTFIDILVPADPRSWVKTLGTRYLTEAILRNGTRSDRAAWLTTQDAEGARSTLLAGGLTGPLNWYKLWIDGINIADDAALVGKKSDLPTLYIGGSLDAVCIPAMQKPVLQSLANKVEEVTLAVGHWPFWEQPQEVNKALDAFFTKVMA